MNMKFHSSRPEPFQTSEKVKLLFLDMACLAICFVIAYFIRFGRFDFDILLDSTTLIFSFFVIAMFYVFGSYDLAENSRGQIILRHLFAVIPSILFVVFIAFVFYKDMAGVRGRGVLLGASLAFAVISLMPRLLICKVIQRIQAGQKWLFLVSQKLRDSLVLELQQRGLFARCEFLIANPEGLAQISRRLQENWSALVLALDDQDKMFVEKNYGHELMEARFANLGILDLTNFYERSFQKVPANYLGHQWFILNDGFNLVTAPAQIRLKRLMDLLLSFGLLCFVWPMMLVVTLLIRLDSPGPILYRQNRTGFKGRNFQVLKFRSMRTDAEKSGAVWAQTNDTRITRIGKWIRLTRIDELPQLLNVFRGEMSFIGPRPERPEFDQMLEKEIPYYALRYLVRPGITGWAQVMYPYGASVEDAKQKLEYDLYYIKNHRLWLDVIIVLRTVKIVLFRKGR